MSPLAAILERELPLQVMSRTTLSVVDACTRGCPTAVFMEARRLVLQRKPPETSQRLSWMKEMGGPFQLGIRRPPGCKLVTPDVVGDQSSVHTPATKARAPWRPAVLGVVHPSSPHVIPQTRICPTPNPAARGEPHPQRCPTKRAPVKPHQRAAKAQTPNLRSQMDIMEKDLSSMKFTSGVSVTGRLGCWTTDVA